MPVFFFFFFFGRGWGWRAAAALHSAAGRHSVAILITQVGRASDSNKTDETAVLPAGPPPHSKAEDLRSCNVNSDIYSDKRRAG